MARKRMIAPSFWSDEKIGECNQLERLLFLGLISNADDTGVGRANPKLLKSSIFPYDDLRISDFEKSLVKLASLNLITLYNVDNQDYFYINNFDKHQTINRPTPSELPKPTEGMKDSTHGGLTEHSLNTHGGLTPNIKEVKLKEVKLKEKDKKEIFENYAKDDAEVLKALYDFAEMRKAIKKPFPTERAKELFLLKLDKLASDSKTKIAILEQSILNNWQGVFELKEGYRGSNKNSNQKPDDKWGDLPGVRNF